MLRYDEYRPSVNQLPFRLSTWHRDGTRLDSLRYHLYQADRNPQFSEFYVRTPGGTPWPEMTFERDRTGRGVHLDVPDLGVQGSGTVSLSFLLEPDESARSSESFELGIGATFRLSETSRLGRDYRAQINQSVELLLTNDE